MNQKFENQNHADEFGNGKKGKNAKQCKEEENGQQSNIMKKETLN